MVVADSTKIRGSQYQMRNHLSSDTQVCHSVAKLIEIVILTYWHTTPYTTISLFVELHCRKQRATLSQRGFQQLRSRGRGEVRMGAGREQSTRVTPSTSSAPAPAPAPSSSQPIDRRDQIIAEILTTEQTYVQSLQSVIKVISTHVRELKTLLLMTMTLMVCNSRTTWNHCAIKKHASAMA
jgi:hypothetical protein